jgi:hypothetical protein
MAKWYNKRKTKGVIVMPKKDGSFRIGCGRYLQGENFIQKVI